LLHALAALPLEKREAGTHWTGGWVDPRASLDAMAKRKNPCPSWKLNPSHPTHSRVNILTELSQFLL